MLGINYERMFVFRFLIMGRGEKDGGRKNEEDWYFCDNEGNFDFWSKECLF